MRLHSRSLLDGESNPSGVHVNMPVVFDVRRQIDSTEIDPVELVMHHRALGRSVREIARRTGIPRSTVGDIVAAQTPRLPEPSPFSKLVEF